jgi:hypothetical protein
MSSSSPSLHLSTSFSAVLTMYFVLHWEYYLLCVHCFLAKRNKSSREENDKVKVKNENRKERDGSECFMV